MLARKHRHAMALPCMFLSAQLTDRSHCREKGIIHLARGSTSKKWTNPANSKAPRSSSDRPNPDWQERSPEGDEIGAIGVASVLTLIKPRPNRPFSHPSLQGMPHRQRAESGRQCCAELGKVPSHAYYSRIHRAPETPVYVWLCPTNSVSQADRRARKSR